MCGNMGIFPLKVLFSARYFRRRLGWEMNKSLRYSYRRFLILVILCGVHLAFAQDVSSAADTQSIQSQEKTQTQQYEDSQVDLNFSEIDSNNQLPPAETTNGVWIFVRMILVLAIIIAAIYALFRFMRKSMGVEKTTEDDDIFLRKISSIGLGGAKSVQIVSLWNKAYILGVSDDNIALISEIDDKEMVDAMNRYADMNDTKKKPRSFEEILDIFTNRGAARGNEEQTARRVWKRRNPGKSAYSKETMNLINALKARRTSVSGEDSADGQNSVSAPSEDGQ